MKCYWTELAVYEREGFTVEVACTPEDSDPWDQLCDCFDNKEQLYEDINRGKYDWFMLRVQVKLDQHVMASEYVGGCLYENAAEVLTDGLAEDLIDTALDNARTETVKLRNQLNQILA